MPGTSTKAKQPMKCADSCRNRSIVLQHARGFINRARPKRASHILLLLSVVVLAGCMPIVATEPSPAITGEQERYPPGIEPLPEGAAGVEGQESDADASGEGDSAEPATITIQRRNVNVRSGPGLDFEVVANAVDGDAFTTTGKSEEGWWRICCFAGPGDAPGEQTRSTWVSQVVVAPNQAALDLPFLVPLFPEDMTASWNVQYECGSRRCAVSECAAVARTEIHNTGDLHWLEINRTVTWEEACGEDSTWPHQIDRIEGTERYPNSTGVFFFDYWVGARPGEANARFRLDSGEEIEAWCRDEQEAEVVENSGWTTIYKGQTCHDVRTGMLVSMEYTKRWFFTGEFEGDSYERAYFGDSETYRVKLESTNVLLATIDVSAAE